MPSASEFLPAVTFSTMKSMQDAASFFLKKIHAQNSDY
jgi:hypothetical protein